MVFEIILVAVLVIETYIIINLLFKVEKLETWIQNIEQEMTDVQTEISEIDDKVILNLMMKLEKNSIKYHK